MNYYESYAHDIEVANSDGVTIYYNWINNNTELEVTSCSDYLYKYSGDVVIPESVEYGGNKYDFFKSLSTVFCYSQIVVR